MLFRSGLEDLKDIQEFTFNKLKNDFFSKNRNKNVQLKLPKDTVVNVEDKYMTNFTWTLTAAPGKDMPNGDNDTSVDPDINVDSGQK